jgi:hypothetical protein
LRLPTYGNFAMSQSMRQAPAEADSWALDPESGDGPLLVYARVLTDWRRLASERSVAIFTS